MKDFDFDELDRAVNSVLSKKDAPSQDAPADSQRNDAPTISTPLAVQNQQDHQDNQDDQATQTASTTSVDTSTESDDTVPVRFNQPTVEAPKTTEESASSTDDTSVETPYMQPTVSIDTTPPPNDQVLDSAPVETSNVDVTPVSNPNTENTTTDTPNAGASIDVTTAHDSDTDERQDEDVSSTESTEPAVEKTADVGNLSNIPVKRGKFMDVVAPASNAEQKPAMAARTGITLSPSTDFSSKDTSDVEVPQPSTVESTTDLGSNTTSNDATETQVASEEKTESTFGGSTDTPKEDAGTPFILDAPVEKRPLNSLSNESSESDTPELLPEHTETSEPAETIEPSTSDASQSANVPKEFDKEIMAVEAHETVGGVDPNIEPNTGDQSNTTHAMTAAATAEPHPIFDTSTLGHEAAITSQHHSSKATWVVVGVSLFIVGAALGVLYFLYGQA